MSERALGNYIGAMWQNLKVKVGKWLTVIIDEGVSSASAHLNIKCIIVCYETDKYVWKRYFYISFLENGCRNGGIHLLL